MPYILRCPRGLDADLQRSYRGGLNTGEEMRLTQKCLSSCLTQEGAVTGPASALGRILPCLLDSEPLGAQGLPHCLYFTACPCSQPICKGCSNTQTSQEAWVQSP